jgi:hypothetical protein
VMNHVSLLLLVIVKLARVLVVFGVRVLFRRRDDLGNLVVLVSRSQTIIILVRDLAVIFLFSIIYTVVDAC